MKEIGIVTITLCKNLELLRRFLESLKTVKRPFLLRLVLDGSEADREKARSLVIGYDLDISIKEQTTRSNFAKNCNFGARDLGNPILLFLNDDVEVHPDFLDRPLEIFEKDPRVAVVGSKCLFPNGRVQHAGIVFMARHGKQIAEHCFKGYEGNHWLVQVEREMQAVSGACLFIRREEFAAVNGFIEFYEMGYEDLDLCFSVRTESNKKVVFTHRSEIIHYENASRSSFDRDMKENIKLFLSRHRTAIAIDFDRIFTREFRAYI